MGVVMVRKCSVIWDGKSCKSGFGSDTTSTKVIAFPTDIDERRTWCRNIPMPLDPENVTEHMGICMRHWPVNHNTKKIRGGHVRPDEPPSLFGETPKSFFVQTGTETDRNTTGRRVTAESRSLADNAKAKLADEISSWDDLVNYVVALPYSIMQSEEYIRLVCLTDDPMIIKFSITIDKLFKVKAYKHSTAVNVRHLIDGFSWQLKQFSQLLAIIDYLIDYPTDLLNDCKHFGEYMKTTLNIVDDLDDI